MSASKLPELKVLANKGDCTGEVTQHLIVRTDHPDFVVAKVFEHSFSGGLPLANLFVASSDLLDALRENHEWHLIHDKHDGYADSALFHKNVAAIKKAGG